MFRNLLNSVQKDIVGRQRELELIITCLEANKHILLEGAPGTTKSTILRQIAENSGLPMYVLEGNADLTPSKLIGSFDPAMVLEHGIKPEYFVKGPLFQAMEDGGILYIDEFNRMASDASNTLIRAIEEGELVVPRYGLVAAHSNFRVVLAQNPFDDVGVGKISRALLDRVIRIKLEYQTALEEQFIVEHELDGHADPKLVRIAVELGRTTRLHPEIKQGASVRGAIDFTRLVPSLAEISESRSSYDVLRDAACAALSGKIWLDPSSEKTAEELIEDLLTQVLSANVVDLEDLDDLEELLKKK
ncbi:MAG: AAA family ATPase [Candidatus Heimdallarchaeota archaeon]